LELKRLAQEVFFLYSLHCVNLVSDMQLKHSWNFHGSKHVVHKTKTRVWDAARTTNLSPLMRL